MSISCQLHLRKIKEESLESVIVDLCGLAIKPSWLNTRSTVALDAGTLRDLMAAL